MSRPTFDPIAEGPKKAGGREVARAKGFEVTFSVDAETEFGDQLLVVGSAPALGSWDPRKGMIMHTDRKSYPRWSCTCSMPASTSIEYKYVINRGSGIFKWEDDIPNRVAVPGSKKHSLLLDGSFNSEFSRSNNTAAQMGAAAAAPRRESPQRSTSPVVSQSKFISPLKTALYSAAQEKAWSRFYRDGVPIGRELKIEKTLGKGMYSVVKKGVEVGGSGCEYAIKIIPKDSAFERGELMSEVLAMSCVDHPNCMRLHRIYEDDESVYFVVDLLSGGELLDRVISQGKFSERDAALLARDVLTALEHLHQKGIVHRDIKPENLLYSSSKRSDKNYSLVKIADFGIARVLDCDSTGTSAREKTQMLRTVAGTPAYVAPEIIRMRRAPAVLQMMTGGGDEATMGDFVNDYEDISRLGDMIGMGGLCFEVGSQDLGVFDKDESEPFFEAIDRCGLRATAAKSMSFDDGIDESILVMKRAGTMFHSSKEKNKPDSWDVVAAEGAAGSDAPYDWELWEEADKDVADAREPSRAKAIADVLKELESSPSSSLDRLAAHFKKRRRDSVGEFSNGYGCPVDVWSFGVVLFEVLTGFHPFYDDNCAVMLKNICRGQISFPPSHCDQISVGARNLIRMMLTTDPERRPSATDCLKHVWMEEVQHKREHNLNDKRRAFLVVRRMALFDQLDPDCLGRLAECLKLTIMEPGEWVFRQGDTGNSMFFIGASMHFGRTGSMPSSHGGSFKGDSIKCVPEERTTSDGSIGVVSSRASRASKSPVRGASRLAKVGSANSISSQVSSSASSAVVSDVESESGDTLGENIDIMADGCCVSHIMDGKEINRMGTGEHFGSAALVHPDWQRRRGVKAIARCELFELHRHDVMSICQQYPSLQHAIDKLNSQSGNLQTAMNKSDAHRSVSPRTQRVRSLVTDISPHRDATAGPLGSMRPIPPPPSSRRPGASPQSRGMDPLSRSMASPETDPGSRCIEMRGKLESAASGAPSESRERIPDVGIGASGGVPRVGAAGFASPDRGSKVLGSMPNLHQLSLADSTRDKGAVHSARDVFLSKGASFSKSAGAGGSAWKSPIDSEIEGVRSFWDDTGASASSPFGQAKRVLSNSGSQASLPESLGSPMDSIKAPASPRPGIIPLHRDSIPISGAPGK